jgi:hypothetical protein
MYGYKLGLKKVGESIPAAPVNVVQPLLSGNGAIGTVVTSSTGSWTGSPSPTFTFDFKIDNASVQNGESNTYTPLIGEDTKTLTVTVTATNSQGSVNADSSNSLVIGALPVNMEAPTIFGDNTFGSTLTTTDGTFTGTAPITYTYQWNRNDSPIAGQTANTYVIGSSDSLAEITCVVTGTNSYGFDSEVSNIISVVDFAPVNTVAPTVSPSGTQSTGTLITADVESWDGVAPITYEYKWTRNGIAISGATASTYTIQLADDGTTIRVEVKGTNAYGTSAFIASSNSVSAVNTVAPTISSATISGTAVVGQTLTASASGVTGIPTPTLSYQWKRGATNIGTNASTYTLVQDDAGNTSNITCVVTATNAGGSANATSNQIARILDTLTNTYITGLTLTSAEIDSFNTLYLALRSNNFHTELDTLQIYSNATSAASTKPLIGSQTVILVNSPTFTRKTGYTMTGTSYIDTGFAQTGSTKFQINNNCFGFGVANKNTTPSGVTGFNNGNITWVVLASNVSCGNQNSGTQGASLFTRTISNQDYATRRNNNANRNGFQDGTELNGTLASTSPTINTRTMFVGAANNAGNAIGIYESGSVLKYLYTGSYNIDPAIMRTIINNFIASL